MKKIKIFIASSNSLLRYRDQIQLEIAKINTKLVDKDIFLHLVKWEDLSSRVNQTRSQDTYNMQIKTSDLFILLASDKVGKYTDEEFEIARDSFKRKDKPYILTYFEKSKTQKEASLINFQKKLAYLGHFYTPFKNFDNLWNQINDEIDTIITKINTHTSISQNDTIHKQLGNIPMSPMIFIGRKGVLENIHNAFFEEQKTILLLNGKGGIGKTTTASAYYFKYQDEYAHLIWTVTETGIDDAILSLLLELNIKVNFDTTKKEQVQLVLKRISTLQNPSLLIIDNADSLEDLQNNYQTLLRIPKIHILITSRIGDFEFFEKHHINKLNPEYAKVLFTKYYTKYDEQKEANLLTSIFKAIDYNTLVIELLAKNINQLNRIKKNYGLEELLHDLQIKGILGISKSKVVQINYRNLKLTKPEEVVKAMYSLTKLSETEIIILSVFAVLPALYIPFTDLEKIFDYRWFDKLVFGINDFILEDLLYNLYEKSWLDFDKNEISFKINPIVAEVVRIENKAMLFENCSLLLLQSRINLLNKDYKIALRFALYTETFLFFINKPYYLNNTSYKIYDKYSDFALLIKHLGDFHYNHEYFNKALKYYLEFYKFAKKFYQFSDTDESKHLFLISYLKIGKAHQSLGNLTKALVFFEKYYKLSKDFYKKNDCIWCVKELLKSYKTLSSIHILLGNLDKASDFLIKYNQLNIDLEKTNNNIQLEIHYTELAIVHTTLENLGKTLNFFSEFLKYQNGVSIHNISINLNKAFVYFEEELELTKEISKINPNVIGYKNQLIFSNLLLHASLVNIDEYLTFQKTDKVDIKRDFTFSYKSDVLEYFIEYHRLKKEVYKNNSNIIGFKNSFAISCSILGEIHYILGHSEKSLSYFLDYHKLKKELYKSTPNNISFKISFAISYSKLGDIFNSLGLLKKSLINFEKAMFLFKELNNSNPHIIGFKNELTIIYFKLASVSNKIKSYDKAETYIQKSISIYQEILIVYPKHKEFQYNLKGAKMLLETILQIEK